MSEHLLIGIASILIAGIGAQWLAWRLKWPSIILLLSIGFIAGPITHLVKPDEVLGPLLLPLVSISVAIILFEGGLGLKLYELKKIGIAVFGLVSLGVLINGVLITLAAHYILGLNFTISSLLGAILVVTGPTVIIPLLRHVRPSGKVGSVIKWEGIVIDPIGAALAVLVYEYIIVGGNFGFDAAIFFLKTLGVGSLLGAAGAAFLVQLLRKYWIPDYLHGTTTLMLVVAVFVLSNVFCKESGLFAVIVMGIILGNQRKVEVQHIVSFKENLGILIISNLFIILSARLDFKDLAILDWRFLIFMLVLVFVARPVSVFLSTIKSGLAFKEKLFISWMAPRGIVAAAIVSIFAFELTEKGVLQAEYLVPVTFLVIVFTVVIYGLSSLSVAQRLGLARTKPQGILILGAHQLAREISKVLQGEEIKVILVDFNARNVELAKENGLDAYEENILDQEIEENIDLEGVGRFLALTANDEANAIAILHFREIFGRSEVYQLYPGRKEQNQKFVYPPSLRGRYLFDKMANYEFLTQELSSKAVFSTFVAQEDLSEETFREKVSRNAIPLFLINEKKELRILSVGESSPIKKHDRIIIFSPVSP